MVPPAGVFTRASSDMLATSSPAIARIVSYARDHLAEGVQVEALAHRFGMTRQNLSLLFRKQARFTPVEMLQHLSVVRAKQLLTGNDLTLAQIAPAAATTTAPISACCSADKPARLPPRTATSGGLAGPLMVDTCFFAS